MKNALMRTGKPLMHDLSPASAGAARIEFPFTTF